MKTNAKKQNMSGRSFRPLSTSWFSQKTGAFFVLLLVSGLVASGVVIKNYNLTQAASSYVYQDDWSNGATTGIATYNQGGWAFYESADTNLVTTYGDATITTSRVTTPPSDVAPSTNVEGYWKFDEASGTTVTDSSGNGRDGSFYYYAVRGTNEDTYNTLNSSAYVDWGSDWVRIPANAAFRPTAALTVELWYKPTISTGNTRDIIDASIPGGGGNTGGWVLYDTPGTHGSTLYFQHANSDVSSWTTVSSGDIELIENQWYHIAAVFDGTGDTLSLYINGMLAGQVADTSTIGYVSTNTTNPIVVGNAYAAELYSNPLRPAPGFYDNMVIYSRALSAADVQARALQIKNAEIGTLISNVFDVGVDSAWTSFVGNQNSIGAATTLNGSISNSDTSITLTDGGRFPAPNYFSIENEIVRCENKTGSTFSSCTRGLLGTSAASHSNGVAVTGNYTTLSFASSTDNSTWSDWTTLAPLSSQSGSITPSNVPNGRYIKYKLEVYGDGITDATFKDVQISYTTLLSDEIQSLVSVGKNQKVDLSWTAPADPGASAITDYEIEYGETSGWPANAALFNDGTSTNTYATVTGLTNDVEYTFRVKALNSYGANTGTTTTETPAFYCIAPVSNTGYPMGIDYAELSGVAGGNTIANYSGLYDAYTFYTPDVITTEQIRQGYGYTLNLNISTGYLLNVAAWIDYDGDGDFEVSEKLGESNGVSSNTSFNFTVPGGATLGDQRLRIQTNYYYGEALTSDSCGPYTYGETEDYTVSILAPSPTPDAVTDLAASPWNGGATLTWTAPNPGTSAITDYIVEYGASSGWPANAAVFSDGTSATTGATVTGLSNDTEYSFRVTAVNGNGSGDVSNTATATPLLHCVPGPFINQWGYGISNVTLDGDRRNTDIIDNDSSVGTYTIYPKGTSPSLTTEVVRQGYSYNINLTATNNIRAQAWIDYNDDGDFLDTLESTEVKYISTNENSNILLTVPVDAPLGDHLMRIEGNYQWQPLAVCGPAYSGEYEDYTITVTEPFSTPDGVRDLAGTYGNTEVSLSWSDANAGASAITDYVVEYGATSGWPANAAVFSDGVSSGTGATVTGLTNDVDYTFRVYAVNGNGNGEYSNEATAMPSLYCIPTVANGTGYGITRVLLNAVPGGNSIDNSSSMDTAYSRYLSATSTTTEDLRQGYNYELRMELGAQSDAIAWIDYDDDDVFEVGEELGSNTYINYDSLIPFTVPGSAPLGNHRMRVFVGYQGNTLDACSSATYGEYEDYTISVLAPLAVPDPVDDLAATPGNAEAVLTWSEPNIGTSAITDYIVEYGASSGWPANAAVFSDGTSATTGATVTGLSNDTEYSFRVTAVNVNGSGDVSNTATTTPILYCIPTISIPSMGISQVTLSGITGGDTINNSSALSGTAFTFYPASSTTTEEIRVGRSYSLNLSVYPSDYIKVGAWIDYNQDGVYDDSTEKLGENLNYYNASSIFPFTVPGGATTGNTHLRVRTAYYYEAFETNSCGTTYYGETEDYIVTLLPAIPDVLIDESSGDTTIAEDGSSTDMVAFSLATAPTDTVTVTVTPSSQLTADSGTSPVVLTFTTGNWNTPQTILVGAVDDSIYEPTQSGTLGITTASSDTNYNNLTIADVDVTIQSDNDYAGITKDEGDGIYVTEGSTTDTYTLVLTSQPTDTVTISVNPYSQVTVNGSTTPIDLTFTTGNWNTPQTVTVAAIADYVTESSPHTGTIFHSVTSNDTYYNSYSLGATYASITDTVLTQSITITESDYSTPATTVTFDGSSMYIHAVNPSASGNLSVTVENTTRGDTETVSLTETGSGTGIFNGTITTGNTASPTSSNNIIEGKNGDIITASFIATGSGSTLEDFEGYTDTTNMHAANDWLDMLYYGYETTLSSPNTLETSGPETGNSSAKWLQKVIDKDGPDNLFGSSNTNTTLTANTYLTLTGSITTSDTMINVDDVSILEGTSGTIYIGSDSISFSGVSGNTLTGVSGIGSTYNSGTHAHPNVIKLQVADGSAFPGSNFKARIDSEIFFCSSATSTTLSSCNRRSDAMVDHTSSTGVYLYDDNPWGLNVIFTPSAGQNFQNRDFSFKFYVDDTAKMSSSGHNFGWLGGGGTLSSLTILLLDSNGGSPTAVTIPVGNLVNGWQTITVQESDFSLSSGSFNYDNVTGIMIFASSGDGALDGTSYNATFKLDDFALGDIVYSDTTTASTPAGATTTIKNSTCSSGVTNISESTICLEVADEAYGTNSGAPDIMEIIVTSSGGDAESVNLTETGNTTGIYQATVTLAETTVTRDDGTLQIAVNESVKLYYPFTYKFVSPTTANTTSTTYGAYIFGDSQCPGGGNAYSGTACSYRYGSQITEAGGNPALEQTAYPLEFNLINQGASYTAQLTLDETFQNFAFSTSTTTHSSGYNYSYLISEQITPANIEAIHFSWYGKNGNESGKNTKLYLWNGTSNLYEEQSDFLPNNTATTTELETTLSNPSSYLESNRIEFAVMSNTNNIGYNSVDYAELKVGANATQDSTRIDSATYAGLPGFTITESDYSTPATEITLGNAIYIKLNDASLSGTGVQAADITTGSDHETITLIETGASTGIFTGSMTTAEASATANDGTLQGAGEATVTAKILQTTSIEDFESLTTGTLSSAWNTVGYSGITVETTDTNFLQHNINGSTNPNGFVAFKTSYQSAHENFGTNGIQMKFKVNDKAMLDGTTGSTFSPMGLPVPLKNVSVLLASGAGPSGGGLFEISPNLMTNNQWIIVNLPQNTLGSYGTFGALDWSDVAFFIIAAATGNGTTGNSMIFSLDNINKLTSTALHTDTATFAATTPSCGAGNACTGVGVVNTAPNITSATNDNSNSSAPTNNGSSITFTATAADNNGDNYYLIVCDAGNTVTATNNGAPTCSGTQICVSSSTASGNAANCNITASTSSETVAWTSFVCDHNSASVCSSASNTNSPYAVNHRPSFGTVTATDYGTPDSNTTIEPGEEVFVSTTVTDLDEDGTQDNVYIAVCSDGSTFGGPGDPCGSGTEFCTQWDIPTGPSQEVILGCTLPPSLTPIPTPHGNYDYEVFVYDSHDFEASESSAQIYAVTDVAPVVDSITLVGDGDSEFNFSVASETNNFNFTAAVHDDNGDNDIVSANGKLYDTLATGANNEGTASCDSSTVANTNAQQECYTISNCTLSDVSGLDKNATVSCTAPLYFVANPSPINTNPPYDYIPSWKGYVSISDESGSGNSSLLTTPSAIVAEFIALDVRNIGNGTTASIGYLPLDPGQTSSSPVEVYMANVGNVPFDIKVKGTDLCTQWQSNIVGSTCLGYDIPAGQQKYAITSGTAYTSATPLANDYPGGAVCAMNDIPRRIQYDLSTNEIYNIPLFFQIKLPETQETGSYIGQNTFTAYTDSTCQ